MKRGFVTRAFGKGGLCSVLVSGSGLLEEIAAAVRQLQTEKRKLTIIWYYYYTIIYIRLFLIGEK